MRTPTNIKVLLLALVLLTAASTAKAQYAELPPDYVSKIHPGKLVRHYDQFYLNGERIKSYKMVNVLDLMDYSYYIRAHKMYKASEYIAFAGAVTTVVGGAFIAMNKTFPDKFPNGLGQALAVGGATALFCIAIPLDYVAQSRLRKVALQYNKTH